MRTVGNCAVQQGLTTEAASIVKQAVTLAKRRGHAQVTPLHVANTMLSVTNGILRTACLKSHSHPLHCKALELCFNVALNRLPTSSSCVMFSTHSLSQCRRPPSISNALVAAFKRAQAHQRRGSIENHQQPILVVKIELERLVISILDDPSVSRVMREAGFSSTQVKSNVEQAVSLEICSLSTKSKENINNLTCDHQNEEIQSVIDSLMKQRRIRSTVIVGESVASLEGVVRGVMDKVDKGDVGENLRGVKFISLSLSDLRHDVSRVEVEHKIEEIRILATKSRCCNSKGYILYLGDLDWVFEYYRGGYYYCALDHMIMEIGKLVSGVNGEYCGRLWVMGIATFRGYMRCKNGHPSLEAVWGLHPVTIPAGSLSLSLITDNSGVQNQCSSKKADNNETRWLLSEGEEDDQNQPAACFAEHSAQFETEVRSKGNTCNNDSTSSLPTWLQQYKNENKRDVSNDQNSVCGSIQKQQYPSQKVLSTFSSISLSGFSYEPQLYPNLLVVEPIQSLRDHHMWNSESGRKLKEATLRMYIPESNTKQPFSSSTSSTPNCSNLNFTSSSDAMEVEYVSKFKELNSENLKTLCNALEEKVPWQKNIIPEISSTVLQCRSGMLRRKGNYVRSSDVKEETWLFFQGVDVEAKEKIATELARLIFGSQSNNLISISLSNFSSPSVIDSTEEYSRNKRSREETSCRYFNRFVEAVSCCPHRVFLVEDIEQADYCSKIGFKRAIERGRVEDSNGDEVGLSDAIIILSCESSFSSRSRDCSPSVKQKSSEGSLEDKDEVVTLRERSSFVSLDLNISIDDDGNEEDYLVDDVGLLEAVDRRIIFKIKE